MIAKLKDILGTMAVGALILTMIVLVVVGVGLVISGIVFLINLIPDNVGQIVISAIIFTMALSYFTGWLYTKCK